MNVGSKSSIEVIQNWYHSHCNGDWEHVYGISLETVDNPGWKISIDLEETLHAGFKFRDFHLGSANDEEWIIIRKMDLQLIGACSPQNLSKMLDIIATWLGDITHDIDVD